MVTYDVPGPAFLVSCASDWWRTGSVDGEMFLRNGERYRFEAHPERSDLMRCTQQFERGPSCRSSADMGQISYRKILKAYVAHVGDVEGVHFIQTLDGLTAEENAALAQIAVELDLDATQGPACPWAPDL